MKMKRTPARKEPCSSLVMYSTLSFAKLGYLSKSQSTLTKGKDLSARANERLASVCNSAEPNIIHYNKGYMCEDMEVVSL